MEKLFAAFPAQTKEQWLAQAQKDLKGADLSTLQWATNEGFSLSPFFADTDAPASMRPYAHADLDPALAVIGGARHWAYRQHISVTSLEEANKKALYSLNNGAESICFDLTGYTGNWSPAVLLKDILLPYCAVSYILGKHSLKALVAYWEESGYEKASIYGSLEALPDGLGQFDGYALTKGYANFKSIVLHSQGSETYTDMLGGLLAQTSVIVNGLQELGTTPAEALAHIAWSVNASNNYFFQIAAQRALRLNISLMAALYGIKGFEPSSVHIHATTQIEVSEQTQKDPEWNMLSNTTQAMSAIIGGCNSLSIVPHNQGIAQTDAFAERIARNISNLLREESYLDKVSDPAAGSYYLECLTEMLAQQGWDNFRERISI